MPQQIPLTNFAACALVDDPDYVLLMQWRRNSKGYAVRTEVIHGKRIFINMHRAIMDAPRGLYVDHIWVQGQMIHLGNHDKAIQASFVYDHAARRYFGEFARLNHPTAPRMEGYEQRLDAILAGEQPLRPFVRMSVLLRYDPPSQDRQG